MDNLIGILLIAAIVVGLIRGLTDKRPSFWRGFGEGLAGKGEVKGSSYLFFHDQLTGLAIGTKLDEPPGPPSSTPIAGGD